MAPLIRRQMTSFWRNLAWIACTVLVWPGPMGAVTDTYSIDPMNSHVTIEVGKAGAFSFIAGHRHEVTGPIENGTVSVDPRDPSRSHIQLAIAASRLTVSGVDEPPDDRPKVQEAMDSDRVLDVAQYPQITFESTAISVKDGNGRLDLVVNGRLRIRDVTQPVSVAVRVTLTDHALAASGRFMIKQSAFGIRPISVGGVVAVKDALDIAFSIVARR